MIENMFPIKCFTEVKASFHHDLLCQEYIWAFIVIAHSCQYLSTHNKTQLKRLWTIQWPQTEIFWMSFWVFYKSFVVLCWKKEKSYSNSFTISWKSGVVWLSLISTKSEKVFYTVIMLFMVSNITQNILQLQSWFQI